MNFGHCQTVQMCCELKYLETPGMFLSLIHVFQGWINIKHLLIVTTSWYHCATMIQNKLITTALGHHNSCKCHGAKRVPCHQLMPCWIQYFQPKIHENMTWKRSLHPWLFPSVCSLHRCIPGAFLSLTMGDFFSQMTSNEYHRHHLC